MKKFPLLLSLLLCFTIFSQDSISVSTYDFESIKDTTNFKKAFKVFDALRKTNKYEETILFSDRLAGIAKKINLPERAALVYTYQGMTHVRNKAFFQANESYKKAETIFQETNNLYWLSEVYNLRFVSEYNKGNLEKGADYLLESKMYAEKLKDSMLLHKRYNNLGIIYGSLNNNVEAEKFFNYALELNKQIPALKDQGRIMNNLGTIYLNQKKHSEAKDILTQAIEENKKANSPAHVAHSYSILANVALNENELKKAIAYYDTSSEILKTTPYPKLSAHNTQELGRIQMILKNYKKADQLLTQSRKEFIAMKASKSLLENYKFSSKLDSLRGNLHGALAWHQKHQVLSDKKLEELSTKKIERAEERYKAELEQLRKIDEQEKNELRSQQELLKYRFYMVLILAILAISLVFLFWVVKTRKERKSLIKRLDSSNQIKNKLFSIISHDLKNEIHSLESSLNLMKDNQLSPDEFEMIIPLLANRTHQTSILLNNLLNWSKSQLRELSAKPTSFDINEVIKTKFEFFKAGAEKKNIQLVNELDANAEIYADKDMIGIVAQNLIANAVKFCQPGDTIALVSEEKNDHYEIGFKDTGVGIAPDNIKKLFAEETFTTSGTQNESGTGLGLRICKELVELNQGNIRVESTLGEGTTFFISLPKVA